MIVTDLHGGGDGGGHHLAVCDVGNLDEETEAQLGLEQLQLFTLFCPVLGCGEYCG